MPRTTINTRMLLQPVITTINTRLLPTPSLPSLPTLTPTPISVSTPSQIPVPILNPLKKSKKSTPFNIKKPSADPLDNIKTSSKVPYDDNNGDIDDDSLYDYKFSNPGPGTRTAIIAMENDIKNSYDNINYLQKKLLNAKNYDEHNKILNNIDQAKKNIPKKEKELNNLKMGLVKKKDKKKEPTKKIRTDEARSFSDEIMKSLYSPEQRSADLDKEERLLKNDNDKINNLSKKFKKGLPDNEYNKIIDDINKIDQKRKERIDKINKIKTGKIKKMKKMMNLILLILRKKIKVKKEI